jgi:hypothetical protein
MLPHGYRSSLGGFRESHVHHSRIREFYQCDNRILITKINDAHTAEVLASY